MPNILFNAHHSPIGAFASFTLGFPGASGGLGLEIGKPADQNVYIGVESEPGNFKLLPFYSDHNSSDAERYTQSSEFNASAARITAFSESEISRTFHLGTDTWTAGPLAFRIYSPVVSIPDPATASDQELKSAIVPSIVAELTIDNTQGTTAKRAVFGFQGSDPYSSMRLLDDTMVDGYTGIGQGRGLAIVAKDPSVRSGMAFTLTDILDAREENLCFGLGLVGALIAQVPAGTTRTFTFAICFHRAGIVTTGIDASYLYSRFFKTIEDVATYTISEASRIKSSALKSDALIELSKLSTDQKFMLVHAIRSYYGSTELLDHNGHPLWVVNEGEYRMMNTFDLTVDHLFFELRMNPWVVRNVLDLFVERYSYVDQVAFPDDNTVHPGGLSFTHDMGIANSFSRPHYSSYEKSFLDGCFSYMTHEQLVNWLCTATTYVEHTHDYTWRKKHRLIFEACLESLLNRDNPAPQLRNGLMSLDSSRTFGGTEITTYDSLDASLGQARNNLYLAVKTWAAYVALERLFSAEGRIDLAKICAEQADRVGHTVASSANDEGLIPAIIGEGNDARIISAIEGLIFPAFLGHKETVDENGRFGQMIRALKRHFLGVLKQGICLFDDGGWKLSSTSDNSWLSKIYLTQHIVRTVLGIDSEVITGRADAAHVSWLLDKDNTYFAWSDQMINGKAIGSKYYPRGVTAILWLGK